MPDPGVLIGGLFVAALVLAGCAIFGGWLARQKGRKEGEGQALGCLLGPLGWLIELLLPDEREKDGPT